MADPHWADAYSPDKLPATTRARFKALRAEATTGDRAKQLEARAAAGKFYIEAWRAQGKAGRELREIAWLVAEALVADPSDGTIDESAIAELWGCLEMDIIDTERLYCWKSPEQRALGQSINDKPDLMSADDRYRCYRAEREEWSRSEIENFVLQNKYESDDPPMLTLHGHPTGQINAGPLRHKLSSVIGDYTRACLCLYADRLLDREMDPVQLLADFDAHVVQFVGEVREHKWNPIIRRFAFFEDDTEPLYWTWDDVGTDSRQELERIAWTAAKTRVEEPADTVHHPASVENPQAGGAAGQNIGRRLDRIGCRASVQLLDLYLERESINLTDFGIAANVSERTLRNFRTNGYASKRTMKDIAKAMNVSLPELAKPGGS